MNTDSIKSAARRAAWKSDSKLDEWNPFNRSVSRESTLSPSATRDATGYDEEAAVDTSTNGKPTAKGPEGRYSPDSPASATDVESQYGAASEYYRDTSRSQTLKEESDGLSRTASSSAYKRNGNGILGRVPENEKTAAEQEKSPRMSDGDLEEERKRRHDEAMKRKIPFMQQVRTILFPRWITINWLLLAVPVGIALHAVKATALAIFIVNFIAIIPLAGILSFATEEIAMRVGEVLGGLLNASFG
jgi:Ca2+:H+ antiporter